MSAPATTASNTNTNTNTTPTHPPTATATATATLLAHPPAGFARRVSFDNYASPTVPLASGTLPPLRPATPATPATSTTTTSTTTTTTTSILKTRRHSVGDLSRDGCGDAPRADEFGPGVTPPAISSITSHGHGTNSHLSAPQELYPSTDSSNNNTNNNNVFPSNYTLQSTTANTSANSRKKSYQDLSDSELLALDSQFNFKPVDIQKSYGFAPASRLSYTPLSDCDKNTLNSENHHFKNLSPNAILKEYPTKPIITKNSICINFKHDNLLTNESNNKFYLILLSKKSASLASLNYYMKKISSKGDTIVICCSLSTSILGNEKSTILQDFISNFTQTILSYLHKNTHPINITFEFFKSYSYLDQVLDLYQPSLIIVGTNNSQTKSTSITTTEKKLISLVYVGNDQFNETSSTHYRQSEVSFKLPNRPSIKSPIASSDDIAITDTDDDGNTDNNNNNLSPSSLSKQKTNDTVVSSLFDNLNDTPTLDFSNDTTTGRRKSFLLDDDIDPLTNDSLTKLQLPPLIRNRSSGNAADIDRQQLFEKYNRRLSQVNVEPKKTSPAGQAQQQSQSQSQPQPPTVEKRKKSGGFLSKLFSKS